MNEATKTSDNSNSQGHQPEPESAWKAINPQRRAQLVFDYLGKPIRTMCQIDYLGGDMCWGAWEDLKRLSDMRLIVPPYWTKEQTLKAVDKIVGRISDGTIRFPCGKQQEKLLECYSRLLDDSKAHVLDLTCQLFKTERSCHDIPL